MNGASTIGVDGARMAVDWRCLGNIFSVTVNGSAARIYTLPARHEVDQNVVME